MHSERTAVQFVEGLFRQAELGFHLTQVVQQEADVGMRRALCGTRNEAREFGQA